MQDKDGESRLQAKQARLEKPFLKTDFSARLLLSLNDRIHEIPIEACHLELSRERARFILQNKSRNSIRITKCRNSVLVVILPFFVEGLRSVGNDENYDMRFERKAGAFKDFCKNALETDNENLIRARFSCPDACVEVC